MKRLLAFTLALALFAAPAVALAEDHNRAPVPPFGEVNEYLKSLMDRAG